MTSTPSLRGRRGRAAIAQLLVASLLVQAVAPAFAGITDISSVPLGTFTAAPPRANLMFILDNSTSMERDYLPEDNSNPVYYGKCFGYSGLNKIFYNPYQEYVVPPQANFTVDGNFATPTLASVPVDGFVPSGTKANLNTAPTWSNAASGSTTTKYYYTTYTGTGTATTCTTATASQNQFTAVTALVDITAAKDSAGAVINQSKNYAIWYAFYRTRILAMRSAVGRVLAGIDATKFRVGYSTIIDTGTTNGDGFHNIAEFDAIPSGTKSNRTLILEKLYKAAVRTNGNTNFTPLRPALSKAGRYYATSNLGANNPIQYSCQRNYAFLTTDGYWNTAAEPNNYKGVDKSGAAFTASTGDAAAGAPYQDSYPYTLADIAYYYYDTDLRPDLADNVKAVAGDPSTKQHMNTFTLGLGLNGVLAFKNNYTAADLTAALNANGGVWPDPLTNPLDGGNSVKARIDDLWHAAVNGRGRYYSASNPQDVVNSLKAALDQISSEVGQAAAATASSLSPVAGDDQFFLPGYLRDEDTNTPWQGTLQAYRLTFDDDQNIETPDLGKPEWKAQDLLTARTQGSRNILFAKSGALTQFTYDNLTATQKALFDNRCATNAAVDAKLAQCDVLDAAAKVKVTGDNLVKYVRGDNSLYLNNATAANAVFRTRKSLLGDIINSSPITVGKPPFIYTDAGYSKFVTDNETRQRMVYVGANDGMLHAFDAATGAEVWAYVPTAVMPNLWRLAESTYDSKHLGFVDATPTLADVKFADGTWHTILVGGLGTGGRMYYALDVTTPGTPKLLWEFGAGENNLGLTFGNPVVTKFVDNKDKWYAVFSSGYNNFTPGDGKGYLYALDVETGVRKFTLKTDDVGTATVPTNFGKINSWILDDTDNTTIRFYGGDMQGRMWRFADLDKASPVVTLVGSAVDTAGKKQPITTRPVLTALAKNRADNPGTLVSFGTGKYLHPNDLQAEPASSIFSNQQSIYLVNDPAAGEAKGSLRARLTKLVPGAAELVFATNYASTPGYYVDLTSTGERVNVDGQQFNGLISIASGIPDTTTDPCVSGGKSTLYYFNVRNSKYSLTANVNLVVGGIRLFKSPGDGSAGGSIIWTTNKGTYKKDVDGVGGAAAGSKLRRSSWRELVD